MYFLCTICACISLCRSIFIFFCTCVCVCVCACAYVYINVSIYTSIACWFFHFSWLLSTVLFSILIMLLCFIKMIVGTRFSTLTSNLYFSRTLSCSDFAFVSLGSCCFLHCCAPFFSRTPFKVTSRFVFCTTSHTFQTDRCRLKFALMDF